MRQKIIVLSGKQFSGKDTIAKILLENLNGFTRIGLGDAIKQEYGKQNNLRVEEIEQNKSDYRQDLIELGDWGRAIDDLYWIKNIVAKGIDVIIPDMRVKPEFDYFKSQNAFKIRVDASEAARSKRGKITAGNDPTETALDNIEEWDYVIENEEDYETLKQNTILLVATVNKFFQKN